MNIQKDFVKAIYLLENHADSLDVAECLEEMKNAEVFFTGLRKLEKEHFIAGYATGAELEAFGGRKLKPAQVVALLESFEQSSEEDIYFVTVTTEEKTYLVFTDDGLQEFHGIVTSKLDFENRQIQLDQNALKGLPLESYIFLNGMLQQ